MVGVGGTLLQVFVLILVAVVSASLAAWMTLRFHDFTVAHQQHHGEDAWQKGLEFFKAAQLQSTSDPLDIVNDDDGTLSPTSSLHLKRSSTIDHEQALALGRILTSRDEHEEAALAFRLASTARPEGSAEAQLGLGLALRSSGRPTDAIEACTEAERLDPTLAAAHACLGSLLSEAGDGVRAVTAFRRAGALEPNSAEAAGRLGAALVGVGEADEATTVLARALAMGGDPLAAYNLGVAWQLKGETEKSTEAFARSVELQSTLLAPRVNLGVQLLRNGHLDEAEEAFLQVLEMGENEKTFQANDGAEVSIAAAHSNLGSVLERKGRPEEALDQYSLAFDRGAGAPASISLARLYRDMDHLEESLAAAQRALGGMQEATDSSPWLEAGLTLEKMGRFEDAAAMESFLRASCLAPDDLKVYHLLQLVVREAYTASGGDSWEEGWSEASDSGDDHTMEDEMAVMFSEEMGGAGRLEGERGSRIEGGVVQAGIQVGDLDSKEWVTVVPQGSEAVDFNILSAPKNDVVKDLECANLSSQQDADTEEKSRYAGAEVGVGVGHVGLGVSGSVGKDDILTEGEGFALKKEQLGSAGWQDWAEGGDGSEGMVSSSGIEGATKSDERTGDGKRGVDLDAQVEIIVAMELSEISQNSVEVGEEQGRDANENAMIDEASTVASDELQLGQSSVEEMWLGSGEEAEIILEEQLGVEEGLFGLEELRETLPAMETLGKDEGERVEEEKKDVRSTAFAAQVGDGGDDEISVNSVKENEGWELEQSVRLEKEKESGVAGGQGNSGPGGGEEDSGERGELSDPMLGQDAMFFSVNDTEEFISLGGDGQSDSEAAGVLQPVPEAIPIVETSVLGGNEGNTSQDDSVVHGSGAEGGESKVETEVEATKQAELVTGGPFSDSLPLGSENTNGSEPNHEGGVEGVGGGGGVTNTGSPEDSSNAGLDLGESIVSKGRSEDEENRVEAARRQEEDSKSARSYLSLGKAYLDKGKIDKALKQFKKATKRDPSWWGGFYQSARAFLAMGDNEGAAGQLILMMDVSLPSEEGELQELSVLTASVLAALKKGEAGSQSPTASALETAAQAAGLEIIDINGAQFNDVIYASDRVKEGGRGPGMVDQTRRKGIFPGIPSPPSGGREVTVDPKQGLGMGRGDAHSEGSSSSADNLGAKGGHGDGIESHLGRMGGIGQQGVNSPSVATDSDNGEVAKGTKGGWGGRRVQRQTSGEKNRASNEVAPNMPNQTDLSRGGKELQQGQSTSERKKESSGISLDVPGMDGLPQGGRGGGLSRGWFKQPSTTGSVDPSGGLDSGPNKSGLDKDTAVGGGLKPARSGTSVEPTGDRGLGLESQLLDSEASVEDILATLGVGSDSDLGRVSEASEESGKKEKGKGFFNKLWKKDNT